MSRKYLQELIRTMQEFYKCPSCNTNYHFDDIKFLGQIESYCFVQLNCHSCSMPVLATVSLGKNLNKRTKNELSLKEEEKFARKGAISSAEIAEFHRSISTRKGGFGKLS